MDLELAEKELRWSMARFLHNEKGRIFINELKASSRGFRMHLTLESERIRE
jgi:hypothetical protein